MFAYTHVRFIPYYTPTVGCTSTGVKVYGLTPGSVPAAVRPELHGPEDVLEAFNVQPGAGLTDLQSLYLDAKVRLERLMLAIRYAQTVVKSSGADNSNTLKLFVAPEFYFRPAHDLLSYPAEVYQAIKTVLRATLAATDGLKHWMVVAGTVMWHYTHQDEVSDPRPSPTAGVTAFNNTALVVRSRAVGTYETEVDKMWISTADGLPVWMEVDGKRVRDPARMVMGELLAGEARLPHLRNNIFKTGGLRFGLEICMDHASVALRTHIMDRRPQDRPSIDVHLVTAAGCEMTDDGIVVRPEGLYCRVDGYLSALNSKLCDLAQVSTYQKGGDRGFSTVDDEPATGFTYEAPPDGELVLDATHPAYMPCPTGVSTTWWSSPIRQQRIRVFGRVRIPS